MIFMTFGTDTFACFIQYGQNTVLKYSDSVFWIQQYSAANESVVTQHKKLLYVINPVKPDLQYEKSIFIGI